MKRDGCAADFSRSQEVELRRGRGRFAGYRTDFNDVAGDDRNPDALTEGLINLEHARIVVDLGGVRASQRLSNPTLTTRDRDRADREILVELDARVLTCEDRI